MTEWFTYDPEDEASIERLLGDGGSNEGAWPEAPVNRPEVLAMLLEVAREQVIAYAPADPVVAVEPVTLEWGDGSTVALSREGDVVTAVASPGNSAVLAVGTKPVPSAFAPSGFAYQLAFANMPASGDGRYLLAVLEAGDDATAQFLSTGNVGPYAPFTTRWLTDPAETTTVVLNRYVYAQLQQAMTLWNAGRTAPDGTVGDGTFVFTPRPLDKTIRGIIRPMDGKPHVL